MQRIQLGHGSGGRQMQDLIKGLFQPEFEISELNDSAVLMLYEFCAPKNDFKLAFTTDSYVVSPIFFPGGNIGNLAINGTVNDLAVVGAVPKYISVGFIIEEGFLIDDLKKIVSAMSSAAKKAGVKIVVGDTKVTEKGKADGIFINTSGIGFIPKSIGFGSNLIMPGDKIIVSGLIGNHGIAVMSERHRLSFEPVVLSDTAPLNGLVQKMLQYHSFIRIMRDPTRGGISSALNEIAISSGLQLIIYEDLIPYSGEVKGACELLGIDVLDVANEGILLAIVSPHTVEPILEIMRSVDIGLNSTVIGEVGFKNQNFDGIVMIKTSIGGTRIVSMPYGEQLPRIC